MYASISQFGQLVYENCQNDRSEGVGIAQNLYSAGPITPIWTMCFVIVLQSYCKLFCSFQDLDPDKIHNCSLQLLKKTPKGILGIIDLFEALNLTPNKPNVDVFVRVLSHQDIWG